MHYETHVFKTKKEAIDWGKQYLRWYAPGGYGTIVREPRYNNENNQWTLSVSRYTSCD